MKLFLKILRNNGVCRDCHDVITWYQDQVIPKFKKQLEKI